MLAVFLRLSSASALKWEDSFNLRTGMLNTQHMFTTQYWPHTKNKVNTCVWSNQFSVNPLTYCCITLGLGSVILHLNKSYVFTMAYPVLNTECNSRRLSLQHGVCLGCRWRNGLQIRRIATNILIK